MNTALVCLAKADLDLFYVWEKATIEGKAIIVILIIFSIETYRCLLYTSPSPRD